MGRYIDADALKKYISCIPALEGWRSMLRTICEWVDKQPTADVAPVVHGEWLVGDPYMCSVCEKMANDTTPYCPNCGAKMKSEGESAW